MISSPSSCYFTLILKKQFLINSSWIVESAVRDGFTRLPERLARRLNISQRLIEARLSRGAHASRRHACEFATKHVPVILSLTSHGDRINSAHIAIETLLRQTAAAERVILWISDKHSISGLPAPLHRQMVRGLDVRLVPDIGPYTKIFYALREFPEHAIVTVDDDSVYAADLIGRLYDAYTAKPDCVHCHRAHEMIFNENGCLKPYWEWRLQVDDNDAPSHMIFPTGVGGVLYPPGALHPEVLNQEVFRAICPTGRYLAQSDGAAQRREIEAHAGAASGFPARVRHGRLGAHA